MFSLLKVRQHWQDPLYKNSFFLILTSLSNVGFGFIFWVLAANLYSQENIGVAIGIISSISVIILLCRFGLDQAIISYFPSYDKGKVFTSVLAITTLLAFIFGIVFILGINYWSPKLTIIYEFPLFYCIILIFSSIIIIMGNSFVALRRSDYFFIQSIFTGSRIIFLLPFSFLGVLGIVSSMGLSVIIAVLLFIFPLKKFCQTRFQFDYDFLKMSFNFSIGSYISGLLTTLPTLLLPIVVLNILGAEPTAQYFITFSIASILFMIPTSIGISLFVEGSHGLDMKKNIKKSIFFSVLLLIPAFIFLILFGNVFLSLFGKGYVQDYQLLFAMCLSSFFVAPYNLYISIKKTQRDLKKLVYISLLVFILHMGISVIFMQNYGLLGLGYAWILSYFIGDLIILGSENIFKLKNPIH